MNIKKPAPIEVAMELINAKDEKSLESMFDIYDLREIASHLAVYCEAIEDRLNEHIDCNGCEYSEGSGND